MTANRGAEMAAARRRFPPMWVIYDGPRDYPEHYVVRCWYGTCPETEVMLADSLQEARDKIERAGGSAPLQRDFSDDPCIVEIWL